jgi:hypothetical protein
MAELLARHPDQPLIAPARAFCERVFASVAQ